MVWWEVSQAVKKSYYPDFPGTRVYFTEGDLSCQELYGAHQSELAVKLKLWLLIADRVILSAGHMIRSGLTFDWLAENEGAVRELAEDHALVASLSEEYSDFSDFARDQVEEGEVSAGEKSSESAEERARRLDGLFEAAITWSPQEESELFRELLLGDLSDHRSPLRRRLIGLSMKDIRVLRAKLAGAGDFDRGVLRGILEEVCPDRYRKTIRKYGDCFYYMSGACHKDAFPILHPYACQLYRERVVRGADSVESVTSLDGLWRGVLAPWGLGVRELHDLSLGEVISIRREHVGREVRRTWRRLMKDARMRLERETSLEEFMCARERLENLLTEELRGQRRRQRRFERIRGKIEVGSWVTAGIGVVLGFAGDPAVGMAAAALGVLGLLAGKPILDKAERVVGGQELILLENRFRIAGA